MNIPQSDSVFVFERENGSEEEVKDKGVESYRALLGR